jgi:hypothetical protein
MAPNLRPTLSTRIRASFDGKGRKSDITSPLQQNPLSPFGAQDPAVLRDAIDQAINNEAFQKATDYVLKKNADLYDRLA